jgi:hypothetical protein
MSLRRPQSAQDRGSSRLEHTSSSRSGSNMRGMKVQRQKDWRSFFKLGRVRVPKQNFKHESENTRSSKLCGLRLQKITTHFLKH